MTLNMVCLSSRRNRRVILQGGWIGIEARRAKASPAIFANTLTKFAKQ